MLNAGSATNAQCFGGKLAELEMIFGREGTQTVESAAPGNLANGLRTTGSFSERCPDVVKPQDAAIGHGTQSERLTEGESKQTVGDAQLLAQLQGRRGALQLRVHQLQGSPDDFSTPRKRLSLLTCASRHESRNERLEATHLESREIAPEQSAGSFTVDSRLPCARFSA